jgi:PEP-CTERM motif
MRFSKFCHPLYVAALIAVLFAAPTSSFADQFEVFNLTTDDITFLGLSSNGTAYFDSILPCCGGPSDTCYYAYSNGTLISTSFVASTFTLDDGTPCTPTVPSGTQLVNGICNNGLDAYSAKFDSLPYANVYWGTAFQDIWAGGGGPFAVSPRLFALNSVGDIVFDDEANDNWYEAIDLTTSSVPEPSSILLLGTGVMSIAALIRRLIAGKP